MFHDERKAEWDSGCRGAGKYWGLLALLSLFLAGLTGWLYIHSHSASSFDALFSNPDSLRAMIVGWGPWGALALIGLQVAQVLLAPIPGQALGIAGGYLYGPWLGTLVNMVGTLIGAALAMWLARRFGRPLVQHLIASAWLDRLDELAKRRGAAAFFLIFLFPFLPDDAACFVAGLSPLPLGELLLIVLLGRLPGVFIPNWLGANATELSLSQWMAVIALMIPVAVAFWRWQDTIENRLLRLLDRLAAHVRSIR